MDPRAFCTQARVLVVAGKGGVGKTTVAATVALVAARAGLRTLLIDVEGTAALPALFGHHQPLGYHEVVLAEAGGGPDEVGLAAPIRARSLTPDDALLEYLEDHGMRRISKRLTSTGTLDVIATAIPGIKDLLVLSKVKSIEKGASERGSTSGPDLIVVDAPAAGHAVTFLASARGLTDAVTVGPIRSQAGEVLDMISDPSRCRVLLVTLPEETPVNEAVETAFLLEDKAGVMLAPIVVNGVWPRLGLGDAGPVAESLDVRLTEAEVASLGRAASFRRHRQDLQAAQVARLAEGLPLPQLTLPYLFATDLGGPELHTLADALEDQIMTLPEGTL
ncbi:P-loop NTPase [Acidiferrimicrobium sp. IK]|uniref:ArsA-related P-loop ATPase n=1 Tax=Acidiferrimicrobium sp. IK TaxID=2871700 RepID=UPI0021CB74B1|nr:ArsA-related P-loop ATPase [Acidiferrimicrobium sp. IK]MCU4186223.1 P-loop NTPase [Acidiferrimicrobium sp. IK]